MAVTQEEDAFWAWLTQGPDTRAKTQVWEGYKETIRKVFCWPQGGSCA